MILHAIWIVDNAYGYLKSTFANAALFNTVTKMLLAIQTKSQKACATVDVSVSVPDFCGAGLISAGDFTVVLLSISCSESANKGVSLAEDDDDMMVWRTTKSWCKCGNLFLPSVVAFLEILSLSIFGINPCVNQ